MYPDVCGVVVDRDSAEGIVAVYDHGSPAQQVDTGQGVMGEQYRVLVVRDGQTCVVHGQSTVLYYKPRKAFPSSWGPRVLQPKDATEPGKLSICQLVKTSPPVPEITIRLQADEAGKFSVPYNMSTLGSKLKTTDFFTWFGRQTGRGGERGPPLLNFTFKYAMPVPKSRDIARLNEDDFRYMRKDIMK